MKTHEEIKKGMAACGASEYGKHSECPYNITEPNCMQRLLSDGLALIQQLEAQVPRWISVEERLPEEHQDVLVWAVYHDEDGRDWALEEIDRYCEACGWDNTADAEAREVTHWMPKHKPPEEEGT